MNATISTLSDEEAQRRDALVGRIFQSTIDAFELASIYLGDRLGYYRALAEGGPATPAKLAQRTGTHPRYAREWLEQQAVAGILEVDDPAADEDTRHYTLPAGHAEVLLDADSLNYLTPVARFLPAIGRVMPALLKAYRTGGGVSWGDFGEDAREGQAFLNRPVFLNRLGQEWLPAIPEIDARLKADPPARVADIACGAGFSSVAIARAYPKVRVVGVDVDASSVEMARANAVAAGLADRVTFEVRDVTEPGIAERYDLVTVFEAVHDLSRPVEALRTAHQLLTEGGVVLVMDERVGDTFTAPGDEIERFFYAASLLCCLPVGMSEQPSAGTGTVMRTSTLRRYAIEAGFHEVEVLPIEHPFFRLYLLRP